MAQAVLALAIVVLVVTSVWVNLYLPPQYLKAQFHFHLLRSEIAALADQFAMDEQYLEIRLRPNDKITLIGSGEIELDSAPAEVLARYSSLMRRARIYWLFRTDVGDVLFAGSVDRHDTHYRVGLVRQSSANGFPPYCTRSILGTPYGECVLGLRNDWMLLYDWNPQPSQLGDGLGTGNPDTLE